MKRNFIYLLFAASAVLLSACLGDDGDFLSVEEQFEIDLELIDDYLEENNITAIVDDSGLRYVINSTGNGDFPEITDRVNVTYAGRLLSNEAQFDSNDSISFQLSGLIVGWQLGIPKIEEGGSATLYIPSAYGYGTRGQGSIPPNANLIFDITLNEIE